MAILLFGLSIVAVGTVIWLFLTGERYGRPARPEKGVGFVQDRLDADRRLASLAPKMMLLAKSEAEDAEAARLWRRYYTSSSLAEDDPAAAREELRALETAVDKTLERFAGEGR